MSNPETIEIHGLSTIHKLCKFGAEHNMEGCSFTEIVDRMFAELAKSQAVPEEFVLVPKASLKVALSWMDADIDPWQMSSDCFSELYEHKPILEKAMEAQEQSHE